MKTLEIGDLVKLSFRGKLSLQQSIKTQTVGLVVDKDLSYGCSLVLVKWFPTGATSEMHTDFIELVESK